MNPWESLVEKKIREAMEQGEFDDLPGKGKPVDTSENPFEDPELRMAHRLLRNAGFAPSWVEERKDIDAELEQARTLMARARQIQRQSTGSGSERAWQERVRQFRETVADLNKRIRANNLQVPAEVFRRRQINCEQEIERVLLDKSVRDN
jgi:hypothetical protein